MERILKLRIEFSNHDKKYRNPSYEDKKKLKKKKNPFNEGTKKLKTKKIPFNEGTKKSKKRKIQKKIDSICR